jgi:hypothetical protein
MNDIPYGSILLPYRDPKMGQMWTPSGKAVGWDFNYFRGNRIPDLGGSRRTRVLTNLIANGNFADGDTGWTNASFNAADFSTGKFVGTANAQNQAMSRAANMSIISGHTYCIAGLLKAGTNQVNVQFYKSASPFTSIGSYYHAGDGVERVFSVLAVATETANDYLLRVIDRSASGWAEVTLDNVMLYDLTADSAVDTAANITQLLQDNGVTYHDGAHTFQYDNALRLSGATDTYDSRHLDGSDDYGYPMNSPALDITSAPLAVFVTVKMGTPGGTAYIVCKNLSTAGDAQYAIIHDVSGSYAGNANSFVVTIEAAGNYVKTPVGSAIIGTWQDIGFIWDGAKLKAWINASKIAAEDTYSGSLTSRPNFRIGRRETATGYSAGNMDNLWIYPSADVGAILAHRRWYMRRRGIGG